MSIIKSSQVWLLIAVMVLSSACSKSNQTIDQVEADGATISEYAAENTPSLDTINSEQEVVTPGEIEKRETMMLHCYVLECIALKMNADVPAIAFSENYVNIITGEQKQGLNLEYFEKYIEEDSIYKVDAISELVDYKNIETLTYDNIMEAPDKYYVNNKAGFEYKKRDVLVIVHPSEGSPLTDGCIGIYRLEWENRKIGAGSF